MRHGIFPVGARELVKLANGDIAGMGLNPCVTSDHQNDQEYGRGPESDRWREEDRMTNKSRYPRIGTHGRTYEPGEDRTDPGGPSPGKASTRMPAAVMRGYASCPDNP